LYYDFSFKWFEKLIWQSSKKCQKPNILKRERKTFKELELTIAKPCRHSCRPGLARCVPSAVDWKVVRSKRKRCLTFQGWFQCHLASFAGLPGKPSMPDKFTNCYCLLVHSVSLVHIRAQPKILGEGMIFGEILGREVVKKIQTFSSKFVKNLTSHQMFFFSKEIKFPQKVFFKLK